MERIPSPAEMALRQAAHFEDEVNALIRNCLEQLAKQEQAPVTTIAAPYAAATHRREAIRRMEQCGWVIRERRERDWTWLWLCSNDYLDFTSSPIRSR